MEVTQELKNNLNCLYALPRQTSADLRRYMRMRRVLLSRGQLFNHDVNQLSAALETEQVTAIQWKTFLLTI